MSLSPSPPPLTPDYVMSGYLAPTPEYIYKLNLFTNLEQFSYLDYNNHSLKQT